MPLTIDQFGKALAASGLTTADELKTFWSALPPSERPKDGEAFAKLLMAREKLNQFQADELLSGRPTPLVLGQYVLVDKIGAGGMGQVFKARHRRMKRLVALKVLPAAMVKDEAAVKRFQREVEAAAKLSHPNIVQAFDADEHRGTHYLVMEFVDGRDLSSVVKQQGPLPVGLAVDYMLQAARGLAFAHTEGVIHRDIKPANLLLDKKGTIRILDMGLARLEKGDDGLTGTEQVMGTVDYMSPEQASHTKSADARSDIYSLGCTLWYLLSGQRAYDGETLIERLMAHREAPLPSLVKLRDDASWGLEQALHKMLAKKPADRYQTMPDVVAALEPHAGGTSVLSGNRGRGGSSIGPGSAAKHDPELASFLKTMGPTPKTQAGKPGSEVPSKTAAGLEATEQFDKSEIGTDPKSEVSIPLAASLATRSAAKPQASVVAKRKSKPPTKLIAAGVGGLAIASAVGIWLLTRSSGEPGGSATGGTASPSSSSTTSGDHASGSPTTVAQETEQETSARHRAVAEWFERTMSNGYIDVEADSVRQRIDSGRPLPTSSLSFRVIAVEVPNHPGIPRDMLRRILALEGLQSFGTYGVPFNDLDMQEFLHAPPTLTSVNVEKASFTDDGLAIFASMPQLERLTIGQNPLLSDDGMRHLTALENLNWLHARQIPLGDAGLAHLAKLPRLQDLRIAETLITDRGLLHLHGVRTLTALSMQKTQVTKAGVDALHAALPACRIQWDGGVVEPGSTPPPAATADHALQFAAVGNHVVVEEKQATDMQTLTVEAFVTPADVPANGVRIVQWTNGALGIERGGQWSAHLFSTTPKINVSGGQIAVGKRTHVAVVLHQGKLKLYADGRCVVEADAPEAFVSLKHITIGGSDRFPVFFPGVIDEVRISTTARYDSDFDPPSRTTADADTFALYHCDEGAGDVLADSSTNKRDGKIIGAKWVRADGGLIAEASPTDFALDPAANPNGVGPASIELPRFLKPNDPMTIEMTVTPRSLTPTTVSRSLWTLSGVLELKQYQDHWVWARNNRQADPRIEQVTVAGVVPGKPTQLAAVSDGKQLRLFIDGELVGTRDLVNPPAAASLGISVASSESATGGYQPFDGLIDEIRISNYARYGAGYTPIAKLTTDGHTLGLYHCDEGTGNVLVDSSGKNNHGTINGPQWARADGNSGVLIDLLAAFDPKRSLAVGGGAEDWQLSADGLKFTGHGKPGLVRFPVPLVDRNFRMELEFTRTSGDSGGLNIDLPMTAGDLTVNLDDKGRSGLGKTDRVTRDFHIETGKRDRVVVTITGAGGDDHITVEIDGNPTFDWRGDRQAAVTVPWKNPGADDTQWSGLFVHSGATDYYFHRMTVQWLDAATAQAASPPAAMQPWALDFSPRLPTGAAHVLTSKPVRLREPFTLELYATPRTAADERQGRPLCHLSGNVELKQFGTAYVFVATGPPDTPGGMQPFDAILFENVPLNRRVHLAGVSTGQELRFYLDGKLVGRTPLTVALPDAARPAVLGHGAVTAVVDRGPGYAPFDGTIDAFRLSRSARYDSDFTPPLQFATDADTFALYDFTEGAGDVLHDRSGNGNDGRINGATWVRADGK